MAKKCWKCGSKKNVTRHHIYGKNGLCGLDYDDSIHLQVFLAWLRLPFDLLDIIFWNKKFASLCRSCHDDFHILFTKLAKECDEIESEKPLTEFLEVN